MKKMSCFCASNSSGDSVYSGYFRWRMGLPLPPIPQEESHVLKNANKDIFSDIIGVKHASDFTLEDLETDNTPRRFRRRKNQENSGNPVDRVLAPKDNIKGFRENPLYIGSARSIVDVNEDSSTSVNNMLDYYPLKDEIFVPSQTVSFNNNFGGTNNTNLKNNKNFNLPGESISSFLVKKFLSNIQEYSENVATTNIDEDVEDKNLNNNLVSTQLLDNIDIVELKGPPAIPPHRKPSTIIEESESENGTLKRVLESAEKENIELINSDNKSSDSTVIKSIPIFSIKHGDIDKILSESIGEYDYAYNKSWSKGVEFNLSMNLSGDKKSKRIKTVHQSNQCKKEKNENQINTVIEDKVDLIDDDANNQILQPLNLSINSFTDETDDSIPIHSFPNTSPIPFLKLSSIEADALKPSPTTLSRNSQVSSFFAESETDSRNEPWEVIHGRSIKELMGTRFIDPSIINNNKPALIKGPPADDGKVNSNTSSRNRGVTSSSETKMSKESLKRFHININAKIPLEKQPWYHFYLTRSKAESLLVSHPDGSFLVRRSESNKNAYSLTIKHKGLFLHMKITKNHKGFVLGEYSQPYQSIPHMLYHYCLTMVPVKGADAASLRFAVTRDHLIV